MPKPAASSERQQATTGPSRSRRASARLLRRGPVAEVVVIIALLALLILPLPKQNLQLISQLNQMVTVLGAALSVYVMLRLKLLNFGTPAFMAIGGYAAALTAIHITPNVVVLILASIVVPAVAALPFGLITMRLRGTYFALVSFLIGQVVYLLIIASDFLGGTDGLTGIPSPTLGKQVLGDSISSLRIGTVASLIAVALVITFTVTNGRRIDALRSNEVLATSLGLRNWPIRLAAFVLAAAVAGLSGFLVVNTLATAHPSSFSTLTGVNYVAYVVVGGAGSVLGPILGTVVLVYLIVQFASEGVYAGALLGGLLILTSLFLPRGITGSVRDGAAWLRRRSKTGRAPSIDHEDEIEKEKV
jgi:branched-chain amino acid transport system permease protein